MKKVILFPIILLSGFSYGQTEIDCNSIDQWSNSVDHYLPPSQVVDNGKVYRAKWWADTQPSLNYSVIGQQDGNKKWELVGSCLDGTTGVEVPDPEPTPLWELDNSKTALRNLNSGPVNIGLDFGDDLSLQSSYYKMNIKGRTNIIGDGNAFGIWSADKNGASNDNFRQYIVFENNVYPNTSTSYGVMGSNAYNKSNYTTKGGTDLILQPNGGKLGIGAFTAPLTASLHVKGTTVLEGSVQMNGDLILKRKSKFNNQDGGFGAATRQRALVADWANNQDRLLINYDGDFEDGVVIHAVDDSKPSLQVDGRMTIGTSILPVQDTDFKLAVKGKIMCEELKVAVITDWGDFVFDDDYDLHVS